MSLSFCSDCRFFTTVDDVRAADLSPADREACLQGHCRRNPPAVGRFRGEDQTLEYDYGQWPMVLSCDWCGAFESWRSLGAQTPQVRPRGVPAGRLAHDPTHAPSAPRCECARLP